MKMKSVSAILCYVKNLDKTAEFYEALGFVFRKRDEKSMTAYLNWFWIEFRPQEKEMGVDESGRFVCISVENADEFYQGMLEKGLKPDTAPVDDFSGRRQFSATDPDGYQLLFFHKK